MLNLNILLKPIIINLLKILLKIRWKSFINKSHTAGFINKKAATLATKVTLKAEEHKVIKLQAFHSSYFWGKSHFEDGGSQNYLVF